MSISKSNSLPDAIREAIRNSGLTGVELSEKSGVDMGVISRFLNEKRDMTLETADKICRVLRLVVIAKTKAKKA